ncbi:hypothetical protein DL96DRAFT_1530672 [Flagelloscypha sp. PMI_526]|nr:hypothetical protein DL96DRAFT_1530672 [Flagelloscypha sp. PMI_526]
MHAFNSTGKKKTAKKLNAGIKTHCYTPPSGPSYAFRSCIANTKPSLKPFLTPPRYIVPAMSDTKVEYSTAPAPKDLPSFDDIVQSCAAAGFNRNGVCIQVAEKARFWVKYGRSLTLGEGLTQAQVADIVNADSENIVRVPDVYLIFLHGRFRYIVMQFVEGETVGKRKSSNMGEYREEEVQAVVAAVKALTALKMPPSTPPGPIGGGTIGHNIFSEWRSTLVYPTVKHLQHQINTLVRPRKVRVDFVSETEEEGLLLCLADLDDSNFMVDERNTLWAIDFGCTSYMPRSYVSYSLNMSEKPFTLLLQHYVNFPRSSNLHAMMLAGYLFMITGKNSLYTPPPWWTTNPIDTGTRS